MPVTIIALIFGIFEGLKASSLSHLVPSFLSQLPLDAQNLAWLIPSVAIFVLFFVIDKFLGLAQRQN